MAWGGGKPKQLKLFSRNLNNLGEGGGGGGGAAYALATCPPRGSWSLTALGVYWFWFIAKEEIDLRLKVPRDLQISEIYKPSEEATQEHRIFKPETQHSTERIVLSVWNSDKSVFTYCIVYT